MALGMMNTIIDFETKAEEANKLSQRGSLALLLKVKSDKKYTFKTYEEAVKQLATDRVTLSDDGKKALELAFKGGYNRPYRVYVAFDDANTDTLTTSIQAFESVRFDWFCAPEHEAKHTELANWIKDLNKKRNLEVKAVLVGDGFDCREVVAFDTDDIVCKELGGKKDVAVSKALFTSAIASVLCGTPLTRAISNIELPYVRKVRRLTNSEYDNKIGSGKLVLYNDWDVVRVGRGVNSLQTLEDGESEELKKILIISKMHLWKREIKDIITENYLGKMQNGIDEKMMLVSSIKMYNKALAKKGMIINKDGGHVDIDVNAQNWWLRNEKGYDTSDWTEKQIREAKTGSNVFIEARFEFTDAMEDIKISVQC